MPRSNSPAACSSGRFSGIEATIAPLRAIGLQRRLEGVDRRPPVGVRAAVAARKIEHQHVEVEAARHHRGEGRRHRRLVVPDEGVVVERIGDRDQRPERRLDPRAVRVGQRREAHRPPFGAVGHDRSLAARTAHRRQRVARRAGRAHAAASAFRGRTGSSRRARCRAASGRRPRPHPSRRAKPYARSSPRAPARSGRPSSRRSAFSSSRARAASRSKPATRVEALDMQAERGNALVLDQRRAPFPTGRSAPGCRPSSGRRSAGRASAWSC